MAHAATDQKTIERFAEVVGGDRCTQHEAARAVRISERQGERLLSCKQLLAVPDK